MRVGTGFAILALVLSTVASAAEPTTRKTPFVVAADGSGDYKTVLEAVNAAPQLTSNDPPFEIRIKPGTYKELIYVQREKRFIKLIGEDPATTIIANSLYADIKGPDGLKIGTFRTPTAYIDADDFVCENLTFENSAGPGAQTQGRAPWARQLSQSDADKITKDAVLGGADGWKP